MTGKSIFLCLAIALLIAIFPGFGQGAQTKEEIVKIAVGGEMSSLDHSLAAAAIDRIVVDNWGEFLLNKAPSGEITPGLVASWKMSPDGKKMECTLRKGVKFHSGDFLSTKDVQFSYERALAKNPSVKATLRSVARLEMVDDYRFNFHFKEPDVTFIPYLGGSFAIVSKGYHERVGEETFSKQPSGTGPYKVTGYRPAEYVDLERFEDYWGKKPSVRKARIYFVAEDTTRIAKLKAGEVELIQGVPFTEVKEIEKSPNLKVVRLETNAPTRSIIFGAKNPKMPWYDKRVRLAIALAIDCKSILQNLLNNNAIHLAALPPGQLGYDPEIKPYPYDPKRAKALLTEAGYPTGFEITLNYPVGGRVSMSSEIAEAIAAYLEAVGIRVKLVGKEQEAMQADRNKALDPEVEYIAYFQAGYAGGVDPAAYIGNFMTSFGSRPVFAHPESDKLIAEARTTMDDKKRSELVKKAVKILHEEVALVPVFTNIATFAMKKNIDFNPTKKHNIDFVLVKDITIK
jgi:peptide/nickel transport system substrate-binding protein